MEIGERYIIMEAKYFKANAVTFTGESQEYLLNFVKVYLCLVLSVWN